jgi:hypothetical protein
VRVAIEKGYLVNDEDRPRKPTRLRTADPLPDDVVILPTAETLAALCACACDSDPTHTPSDTDNVPLAAPELDFATEEQEAEVERVRAKWGDFEAREGGSAR